MTWTPSDQTSRASEFTVFYAIGACFNGMLDRSNSNIGQGDRAHFFSCTID